MSTVEAPARPHSDQRSDARGLLQLLAHVVVLGISGVTLVRMWSTLWVAPLVVAYGFALIFLFCAEHECIHRTAFRSRWINDAVAAVIGVLLVLPSRWFRLFHAAHHRYTQDPLLDPELDGWKPPSRSGIVLQMTGLLYWKAMVGVIWRAACGRAGASWMPPGHVRKVVRQARFTVVVRGVRRGVATHGLVVAGAVVDRPGAHWSTLSPVVSPRRAHRMSDRGGRG